MGSRGASILGVFVGVVAPQGTVPIRILTGLAGAGGGWGLAEWQKYYEDMADAIQDQIDYLSAVRDGTCAK